MNIGIGLHGLRPQVGAALDCKSQTPLYLYCTFVTNEEEPATGKINEGNQMQHVIGKK